MRTFADVGDDEPCDNRTSLSERRSNPLMQYQPNPTTSPDARSPVAHRYRTSIILVTWNKVEYTRPCLEALLDATPEGFELVVVDNASTDRTGELLDALEGDVKVIRNPENWGFVVACNQGVEVASGKYVVLLNNDTLTQPGWLEAMADYADAHPDVGAIGSKLIYPDGRLQEAGSIVFSDASGWNFGKFGDASDGLYNFVRDVDYCSGASLLVRRDAWNELGGFDMRLAPAYYEDTDICFALRQLGYRVVYQPASVVIHAEGATNGRDTNTGVKKWQAVNKEKFLTKWARSLARQHPPEPLHLKQAAIRDRKKNILVIDRLLPWFDRASGSLRTFEIVRILREAGHHVTFVSTGGAQQERYAFVLQQLGVEVYAPGIGYAGGPTSSLLSALLRSMRYDTAILTFWDVAEAFAAQIRAESPATEIIVDSVDLHYLREERAIALAAEPSLEGQLADRRRRELASYEAADSVVVVSDSEAEHLVADVDAERVDVVGNIHRPRATDASPEGRSGLFFVGNFAHPPNADAVRWFCDEVWPLVRARMPNLELRIVGYRSREALTAVRWPGVRVLGPVPSLDPHMDAARLMVAPLRYGAGVKGKIGEAMMAGLPVVTTTIGAEGMGIVDGRHALVADSPEDFAAAVLRLAADDALWRTLCAGGRELAGESLGIAAVRPRVLEAMTGRRSDPRWKSPLVSIVVLTWNELEYTRLCLESVRRFTERPYELIIVDNGSADGTPEYLRSLDDVRVILNKSNTGFAHGCNQGIAAARGDYVVLLNNDTVVTEGWLDRLLAAAESDRTIGLVGPVSNHTAGFQLIRDVPYGDDLLAMQAFARQRMVEYSGQGAHVPRAIGFCLAIRREVIDAIGGLDEVFGVGCFEDDDYSIRAQLAGFRIWVAHDSFIHHFGSRTFTGARIDYMKLIDRNWAIFRRKWRLPSTVRYSDGIPYRELLQNRFDPQRDIFDLRTARKAA